MDFYSLQTIAEEQDARFKDDIIKEYPYLEDSTDFWDAAHEALRIHDRLTNDLIQEKNETDTWWLFPNGKFHFIQSQRHERYALGLIREDGVFCKERVLEECCAKFSDEWWFRLPTKQKLNARQMKALEDLVDWKGTYREPQGLVYMILEHIKEEYEFMTF